MRILIVEDHRLVADGIARTVRRRYKSVAVAATSQEAWPFIAGAKTDLVLLDLSLPGRNGFELLRDIRRVSASLPVIVVSMHDDAGKIAACIKAGANGFVSKTARADDLLDAIEAVSHGGTWFPAWDGERDYKTSRLDPRLTLTARKAEVLVRVAMGMTYKQIGAALRISVATVDGHIRDLHEQFGVTTNSALVLAAIQHGFIDAGPVPPPASNDPP